MIYRLIVPGPIEDVEEVRILEWHGKPGAAFGSGAMLVELETHKAVVEVRAGQPGVLRSVLCAAGEWQRIGEALAVLSDTPDEALPDPAERGAAALAVAFEIV
jgi:pyruvate/2-oxoglutarate dehydrogenase complex dihydrolipoamide acyltransferase (E2) component